jgi:hypothetical protein
MQKKPPETMSTNLNSSRSNIYRVKVTKVNPKDKAFTIEATFSAKKLKALPAAGETIDVTYTPTPGGPMEATAVKASKSNSSDRMATAPKVVDGTITQGDDTADRIFCRDHTDTPRCCRHGGGYWVDLGDGGGCNFYGYNYRVTKVNPKDQSFVVEIKFSAAQLNVLPKAGEIIDITYTQTTPGGPLEAVTINTTKSNTF